MNNVDTWLPPYLNIRYLSGYAVYKKYTASQKWIKHVSLNHLINHM
jgi:hypothetical protein